MVLYTCERCYKTFDKKWEYDKHMNKKIPCLVIIKQDEPNEDINTNYCEQCDRYFSRKDVLKTHLKSSKQHQVMVKRNKANNINAKNTMNTKKGTINQIAGDNNNNNSNNNNINNNVTINNYFIYAFEDEQVEKLTIKDMHEILFSENPLIIIILKTNLNIDTPEYHNICYEDIKAGYGIVYNGEYWSRDRIKIIISTLMESKYRDLLIIQRKLRLYSSLEQNISVEKN